MTVDEIRPNKLIPPSNPEIMPIIPTDKIKKDSKKEAA
jgi:hypothetical protein